MNQKQIMDQAEQFVLHTYNRFPVSIDRGEGVRAVDSDGGSYLDFMAGIGVFALGYHYPGYDEALISQIGKTLHTSNLYYSEPLAEAAERLVRASGMSRVFFTNSGTEAVEGAVKAARRYSYDRYGAGRYELIAMEDSFHGRSVGALSVTGNEHYQEPFRPLMGGVRFAKFNDIESVRGALTDRTCAILLETVQGEGGVYPADPAFIKEVRRIADERDLILILDEIQCGMGRSGSMWAFEHYGVRPDILTAAKALGCGVPVGAFLLNERAAEHSLVPGDHGSTYGGNPFACAAAAKVLEIFERDGIVGTARSRGEYLAAQLDRLGGKYDFIRAHRGMGLMRGLEFDDRVSAGKVAQEALRSGLLIITAEHNVLRFLPPLIISEEEIDEGIRILETVMDRISASGRE